MQKIGLYGGMAIVISNMIGTGAFTSLGFQIEEIHSIFSLMLLWALGGMLALCGALCYSEIGAALPQSGGEYYYLSVIYHPVLGLLSGWVSILAGFSAPIAVAAIAFGTYLHNVMPAIDPKFSAVFLVLALTALHATSVHLGIRFQIVFTGLKIGFVLFFIIAGFLHEPAQPITLIPQLSSWKEIQSPAFAVSLVFVTYAYSGWNASVYLAGEIDNVQKNLPRSLLIGTSIVTLLYLTLNYMFLYVCPPEALAGKIDVAFGPAQAIFGNKGGLMLSGVISLLLISTVSAMIISGPRIIYMIGNDIQPLAFLAWSSRDGIPVAAIILQSIVTIFLICLSYFEWIIKYIGGSYVCRS